MFASKLILPGFGVFRYSSLYQFPVFPNMARFFVQRSGVRG